jgi:hypothetical protein
MAEVERTPKKARGGIGSFLVGLVNPIRDPSLLIAIILTVIEVSTTGVPLHVAPISVVNWALVGLLNWIAVKALIWLLVNLAFSSVYLVRKAGWVFRHPRLAWRLLDAMGTEEIIIGGLRPDMFATEDGGLHEGSLGFANMGAPAGYYGGGPALGAPAYSQRSYTEEPADLYDDYQENGYREYGRDPQASARLSEQTEEMREMLASYSKLLNDWMDFTGEKWRAVSDSQLGWKPLRGRWNGWEEIYRDAFAISDEAAQIANDQMARRFDNSQTKGSAASSVVCFLRDLDSLRQSLTIIEGGEIAPAPRMGGVNTQQPISQRTNKGPIIRNPMIVDADR